MGNQCYSEVKVKNEPKKLKFDFSKATTQTTMLLYNDEIKEE